MMALMEKVFKQAWPLARQGAQRFGGRSRSYFASALRLTYVDMRKAKALALRSYFAFGPGLNQW
jgi:hypothetical protein